MKFSHNWKVRYKGMLLMAAVILSVSLVSAIVHYHLGKAVVLQGIDAELHTAAHLAQAALPADYHDQIAGPGSMTESEFNRNVHEFNRLCDHLGLKYLWSLMLVDGTPVFTSATSPDKRVENNLHAKFFEPHTAPELYEEAFRTMLPVYQNNDNKWGRTRVVLLPYYDSHGRKYLFGAGISMERIDEMLAGIAWHALLISVALLVPGLLISVMVSNKFTKPIAELAAAVEDVIASDYRKEINVQGSREIHQLSNHLNQTREVIRNRIDSQDALQQLRQFETIVTNSPMIAFRLRIGPEWPVEFITENINQLGYTAAELLSGETSWYSINYPEDIPRVEKIVFEHLANGDLTYNLEARLVSATGDIRWVENWNRLIRDKTGEVTHIQGILLDVTVQKTAQQREQRHLARMRALTQQLTLTEERERRKLAVELHDDLGQMLVALNMKISVLQETRDQALKNELKPQVNELMARLLSSCKTLTWQLSPPSLYEFDVCAGLKRIAREIENLFGLKVDVSGCDHAPKVDHSLSALLFRSAKELLANAAKHAAAKNATVEIHSDGSGIILQVTDNGKGFNPDDLETSRIQTGFGILSIKESLMGIQGSMTIDSAPSKGTTVTLYIPASTDDGESSGDSPAVFAIAH
ncbi:MAG: PAS domain-containing protein [Kiritimatiellales bacterium]|nr:PAS domain-containing protein [Kiritimatiellales bacterium]